MHKSLDPGHGCDHPLCEFVLLSPRPASFKHCRGCQGVGTQLSPTLYEDRYYLVCDDRRANVVQCRGSLLISSTTWA